MAILNEKKVAANGLLSKIEIGGQVYEIKDVIAREAIDALSYISYTNIFANDAAIKEYVDSQVGSINKFDVVIGIAGENGEPNVAASADTMYKIYLIPGDAEAGSYIEWITIREGDTYKWEAIGSTAVSLDGYITGDALNQELAKYTKTEDLGALAFADNATGTVAGQTISGVKATGNTAGSIAVELQATETKVDCTGKYTPAGNVTGTVTIPEHNVPVTLNGNDVPAIVATGTGNVQAPVSFTPATGNVVTSATQGTQASFVEGEFKAADIKYEAVEANYATEGIVGSVTDECLTFTAAGTTALSASKINSFFGGSKAADSFVTNSLPEFGTGSAITAITDAVANVDYDKVTGVTYHRVEGATATCAGDTLDIAATFAGTEGDVNVAGKANDYSIKTADFNGAAIELAVGDIVVTAKEVTVS